MEDEIYHIVIQKLKGEISPENNELLKKWLKKDLSNENLLHEIENTWKITGKIKVKNQVNVDEEWKRFQKFRDTKTSPLDDLNLRSPKKLVTNILKIAAVLVIGFLLVFSVQKYWFSDKNYIIAQSGDSDKELLLADGTRILLNKNSVLKYSKKFGAKNRKVKLNGEAHFNVAKSKIPFTIETSFTKTRVLGTKFNLKAYSSQDMVELTVQEGKVEFGDRKKKNKIILTKGEYALFNNTTKKIQQGTISELHKLNHPLNFNNEALKEIAKSISVHYNKEVVVDENIQDLRITSSFEELSIEEILKLIEIALEADCSIQKDTIYIRKKSN